MLHSTTAPQRDRICVSCRDKRCCSYYAVAVTGFDVWRIAKAMQLSPQDFVSYCEAAADAGCFLLQPGENFLKLMLAKRPLLSPAPAPCVFLVRTNGGHGLCGLGDLRPGQCRGYPTYLSGDLVALINDPEGCVRTWSYGDVDLDEERAIHGALAEEQREHNRIVAVWNQRVRDGGRPRSIDEFCAFLISRCEISEVVHE
jgi:hypothetical protein